MDKLGVINLALNRIGQRPLSSLADSTESADVMLARYDFALTTVVQAAPWAFTMKTIALTALTGDTTPPGWTYIYQFPTDSLYINSVFDAGYPDKPQPFKTVLTAEGHRAIVSNVASAYIEYLKDTPDISLVSPSFINVFANYLAYEAAPMLVADAGKIEALYKTYQFTLADANRRNLNEAKPMFDIESSYITARE